MKKSVLEEALSSVLPGREEVGQAAAERLGEGRWREQFMPRRFLRNGHLQTLAGNFMPRKHPHLPAPETRLIQVEPATDTIPASHVLCLCHWQPQPVRGGRATLILLHGLEGSAQSQYVEGNAARAWQAGCNVVRMNMRNCGGTEELSPTLYHSGYSDDVRTVMETFAREHALEDVALVGYSMGGNLVLKLAGEFGAEPPAYLKSVVGVSPAMDLAASADALHEPWNRVYEWKFLRGLLRRYQRKVALFPQIYRLESLRGVRTLRQFDDRITAAYSGFTGADDYYARSSSARLASQLAVPTLILHALDDPFVRMLPATRAALLANAQVTLIETEYGGHCAFLGFAMASDSTSVDAQSLHVPSGDDGDNGYWAEKMLLRFVLRGK